MDPNRISAILEALLLTAAEPLPTRRLRELLGDLGADDLRAGLRQLQAEYPPHGGRHGIELIETAGGWQFRTRADMAPWVGRLHQQQPMRLGRAALETLAVIAYRQPITRAELESIRGVDSSGTLQTLLERRLVRAVGRRDMPGRPHLYGTTTTFLDVFGLKALDELPPLEELDLGNLQPRLPLAVDEVRRAMLAEEDAGAVAAGPGPGDRPEAKGEAAMPEATATSAPAADFPEDAGDAQS